MHCYGWLPVSTRLGPTTPDGKGPKVCPLPHRPSDVQRPCLPPYDTCHPVLLSRLGPACVCSWVCMHVLVERQSMRGGLGESRTFLHWQSLTIGNYNPSRSSAFLGYLRSHAGFGMSLSQSNGSMCRRDGVCKRLSGKLFTPTELITCDWQPNVIQLAPPPNTKYPDRTSQEVAGAGQPHKGKGTTLPCTTWLTSTHRWISHLPASPCWCEPSNSSCIRSRASLDSLYRC